MVSTNDLEIMFAETNAKLSVIINLLNRFHPSVKDELFGLNGDGFTVFSSDYLLYKEKTYTLKHKTGKVYKAYQFEVKERGADHYDFVFTPKQPALWDDPSTVTVTYYNQQDWLIKEEV
jgi:hypothetical protein